MRIDEKKLFCYDFPIGKLGIVEENGYIVETFFQKEEELCKDYLIQETFLIKEAKKQLTEYFSKARCTFDLPLNPNGTIFQKKIWKELCTIPYGETRSYKEIAEVVGCPKGARAIGLANNNNPIAIIIPCHRVIGSTGKLVGYAGGLDLKMALLQLEGIL